MTSVRTLVPASTPLPATAVPVIAPMADARTAAIASAKRCWLEACWDGSSATRVQRLYETYRDLVIAQVAAVMYGRTATAS